MAKEFTMTYAGVCAWSQTYVVAMRDNGGDVEASTEAAKAAVDVRSLSCFCIDLLRAPSPPAGLCPP